LQNFQIVDNTIEHKISDLVYWDPIWGLPITANLIQQRSTPFSCHSDADGHSGQRKPFPPIFQLCNLDAELLDPKSQPQ